MVAAGFGERRCFAGFFSNARQAVPVDRALSTALFALMHYPDQGWAGVEQAIFTGSVFGAIFARTGRIWMLMCAHAAFDLAAIAIIYLNLESEIAHLVFQNLATAPK